MSKRTLALIIVLVVITGGLLVAALSSQPQQPTPKVATVTPTTSPAHTKIWMVPETATNSKTPPLDVYVDSNGDHSTGVQLELAYDPTIVTNIRMNPGTFYADPFVLINNIDKKTGRISYAIAIKPNGTAANGKGITATIFYDLLPGATANKVAFTFLSKSKATAEGVAPSVLKTTTDYNASTPAQPKMY